MIENSEFQHETLPPRPVLDFLGSQKQRRSLNDCRQTQTSSDFKQATRMALFAQREIGTMAGWEVSRWRETAEKPPPV
jgi:hypothetical protein